MFKYKCIFSLVLNFVSFSLFATPEQIPEESLKTIPLALHYDAREFYSAVKPVLERNKVVFKTQTTINPYDLYFDSIIFGNLFSLKTVKSG